MEIKKNIQAGKNRLSLFFLTFSIYFFLASNSISQNKLEGSFTDLKILDKISSKNTLIKLKNGELVRFKDLSIKSFKCKNSEFDDNPEITAYLQVQDLTNKNLLFNYLKHPLMTFKVIVAIHYEAFKLWFKKVKLVKKKIKILNKVTFETNEYK